ncbi:hypothetical protein BH10ACI3_BH10ACI3_13150 [soil metagenome]
MIVKTLPSLLRRGGRALPDGVVGAWSCNGLFQVPTFFYHPVTEAVPPLLFKEGSLL